MRGFQMKNVFLVFSSFGHKSIKFFYYPAVSVSRIQLKWKAQSNTHTLTRVKSLKLKQFVEGLGFGFGFWLLVLSLRSIITANMSTEIIAQIDSATTFSRSKSNSNICHFRFKCPAMCCSQTAELQAETLYPLQVVLWAGGAVRSAGNNYSAWFSLGSAANFALPPTHTRTPTHPRTHTHTRTHSHLIYIICAGFCLAFALLSRRLLLLLILFTCPPGGFISLLLLQQSIVLCVWVTLSMCMCVSCLICSCGCCCYSTTKLGCFGFCYIVQPHFRGCHTSSSSGSSSSIW